jgi:hypothetical protein
MAVRVKMVPEWDLIHLQSHLQGVVDLELWTIPYYMTVMYSIKDPATSAFRMIQDAVHQEMLHAQLAGNVANAFGQVPTFSPPVYAGTNVPHINFALDKPNPTDIFTPFSAELGPLDETRINTMCLIEYPEWRTQRQPDLRQKQEEYGSIAEFYAAVQLGIRQLRDELRYGINQVNEFEHFYQNYPSHTITRAGVDGYRQAMSAIEVIIDQGEGQTQGDADVPPEYQNTADGFHESWPHFRKFTWIRDEPRRPETYTGVADPPPGSPGYQAQQTLITDFAEFLATLDAMFSGTQRPEFGPQMSKVGSDILTCWQRNAIPRFS